MLISLELTYKETVMEMRRVFEHYNSTFLPFNNFKPFNPIVSNREHESGCVCYPWSRVVLAVDRRRQQLNLKVGCPNEVRSFFTAPRLTENFYSNSPLISDLRSATTRNDLIFPPSLKDLAITCNQHPDAGRCRSSAASSVDLRPDTWSTPT